jgi:hypothetical protein
MKRLVLIAPLIALAVACGQQPKVEITNPSALGTVDLALGGQLKTQATYISDETQIAITPLAGGYISDSKRNVKYIWGRFQVKNTTGAALNNLTFYALNKSGNNGGTAIKSMTNFVGAPTADDAARAAQPGHAMLQGTGAATVDGANANLQLFTASEVSALGVPAGTGTVLEYGYKVNAASIPDGDTSVVTLSYKIPFASTSTSFTATFAIAKDGPNRVSQSAEEVFTAVNARATATSASEIAYFGPYASSVTLTPPSGVTTVLRHPTLNPKNAVSTPAYIFDNFTFASFNFGNTFGLGRASGDDQDSYTYGYAGAACTVGAGTNTPGVFTCDPTPSNPATTPATIVHATGASGNGGYNGYAIVANKAKDFSGYAKMDIYVSYTAAAGTGMQVKLRSTDNKTVCYKLSDQPATQTFSVVFATATPISAGCADAGQGETSGTYSEVLSKFDNIQPLAYGSATGVSLQTGPIIFSGL